MSKLPKSFTAFNEKYPHIAAAYAEMSDAVAEAGPLDAKTCALIKLGLALGAGLDGGARSQARKALEAGASPDELRHAALQALTTIGFPAMMKGMSLVEGVLEQNVGLGNSIDEVEQ